MRDMKPQEPVFLLWSTRPTVMIGANQVVDLEIDRAKAEAAGVDIVRRSSGGGTIYTDPGTLLYTIILPHDDQGDMKEVVRDYLAEPVISAIGTLGAHAVLEGRNDILIAGKKISGIAQFIKYEYLTSHGSLLFDADLEALSSLLTGDDEKITSKALRSMRSRVTNISEHIPEKSIDVFRSILLESFAQKAGIYTLSENDLAAIHKIQTEKYENPQWTYGRTPAYTYRNAKRYPGGRIEVFVNSKGGVITDCKITGDFLARSPLDATEEALIGVRHDRESIKEALAKINHQNALGSVSAIDLCEVLTE